MLTGFQMGSVCDFEGTERYVCVCGWGGGGGGECNRIGIYMYITSTALLWKPTYMVTFVE